MKASVAGRVIQRATGWLFVACIAPLLLGGCGTAGVLIGAAGIATDTSVGWDIVKHLHGKLTEGDDVPCVRLNSVQRALNARCGAFVPGSLLAQDVRDSKLQGCPLAVAAREPQFWPVLPELLDKGAQPEACARAPLVELAQAQGCPDFGSASPAVLRSLQWLAEADARAIHHDVLRMLSCPSARVAGLDRVLDRWLAQGDLDPGRIAFAPLGALHPDYLATPFARVLEARGHSARTALGAYDGAQPGGFEEALRTSHWAALDWWLSRVPELANRVPPTQGNQLPWVPLARVLVPSFLTHPESQADMVGFLMARGADPGQRLPFDSSRTVLQYARSLGSPMVPVLDPPIVAAAPVKTAALAR